MHPPPPTPPTLRTPATSPLVHTVLGAYKALAEIKAAGKVYSIGVGAKDITSIDWISDHIQLDWAMFACSVTPYTHNDFAKGLLKKLGGQGINKSQNKTKPFFDERKPLLTHLFSSQFTGVDVINSAVFNAGFLIGGSHFDYRYCH